MHTISNRLAALATVLAAVAALAGLAVNGLYVDSPNWVQQAQGTDLATLFLAVPVLALGLWSASRGSLAGAETRRCGASSQVSAGGCARNETEPERRGRSGSVWKRRRLEV